MSTLTAREIRQQFIDYFVRRCGHTFVPSSPCVPLADPTLMFTNAGMNQFKDVFLATGTRPYTRAANTQKCIRAGGKHNDLDDVGHDTYHHTFFEMLGNWSFGDYFKREAIAWAWELLTRVWGLDKSRLHATYFRGDPEEGLAADAEARDLWAEVTDIDPAQIHPGSKKDNFWEMGETGPCGPCSEIHVDLTADRSGGKLVNAGDARVMEIWNLVFIQFNRGPDGQLSPLPARHVDTGMGFERVTALLQGKRSNYDTDVFTPIFEAIRNVTAAPAYGGRLESAAASRAEREAVMRDVAYRVIADHVRCLTFALTDGAVPDREGRGYVLRRILRRAVRYGWQYLGMHEPFLHRLVATVAEVMGPAFPELRRNPGRIAAILEEEEVSFGHTLERGLTLFEEAAALAQSEHHRMLRGADAFRLHDTFGFPIDLTEVMAAERDLRVDIGEYERLMEEARERARAAGKAAQTRYGQVPAELLLPHGPTDDSPKYGSERLVAQVRAVIRFARDGGATLLGPEERLGVGENAGVVTDRTCFYAEQGGQVGDAGEFETPDGRFRVDDTARVGEVVLHLGTQIQGTLGAGMTIGLVVDERRVLTKKNHTATHVLNWALREVLGEHVQQKGSLVDPEKTRFDLSHPSQITEEQLARVEELVNRLIAEDKPVYTQVVEKNRALEINTLRAVFGEQYPENVRVVSIGVPVGDLLKEPKNPEWMKHSVEFCGGTHLSRTGQVGRFRFIEEGAVAKGVRRVTAITGERAARAEAAATAVLRQLTDAAESPAESLPRRIVELNTVMSQTELPLVEKQRMREDLAKLQEKAKKLQKQAAKAGAADIMARVDEVLAAAERVGPTSLMAADLGEATADQLRAACDSLRARAGSAALLLASRQGDRVLLLAAMTEDVVKKGVKAGDLVKEIAPLVGGKGGGRPDMAQGGGTEVAAIGKAVNAATTWLRTRLS